MRIRYDDEARAELRAAAFWYEEHRMHLGVRFHAAVKAVELAISRSPRSYPEIDSVNDVAIRRARVAEFPYGVVFLETGDAIWILAVMHLHRRPGYWRERAAR